MRDTFIKTREVESISLEDYINFYIQIPNKLWSLKPVFYFKDGKWDALGLIGERVHQFNIYSKTLDLYFKDCIGIRITKAIDGDDELYSDIESPKDRFIKYLEFINSNTNAQDLRRAFARAQIILNGRYY